ncbi:MAG: TonB-dependent receptor [Lentisphaeraceae bacterium]|nr:TonB-dependent receptor [Lentisphaeraceae bacterium]
MNVLSSFRKRRLTFIAAIALGLPLASLAQEELTKEVIKKEEVSNTKKREEVVILGEKMGRTAQETTSSVQIFDAGKIQKSTAQSGYDLLRRTANVSIFNQNNISIRGIGTNGQGGDAKSINTYVDGVIEQGQGNRRGLFSSIWDVQQVEVFRGPQSTTQGRDSIAGAIRVKTNDPSYEWSGAMRLGVAEYDTIQKAIAFGGPIIDGTLAFRIAYDDQSSDGTLTSIPLNSDRIDKSSSKKLRTKILWDATDELSFLLTYNRVRAETGTSYADSENTFSRKTTYIEALKEEPKHIDLDSLSLESTYEINDKWLFTSLSSFSDQEFRRGQGFEVPGGLKASILGNPDLITLGTLNKHRSMDQEFRFNYDDNESLRAVVGLYLSRLDESKKDYVKDTLDHISGTNEGPQGSDDRNRDVSNVALFAELDYDINDLWTANIGGRVVHETVKSAISINRLRPLFGSGDSRKDEQSELVFLPKLGLTLHAADNVDLSGTIQRGYRAGGLSMSGDMLGSDVEIRPYDPEYSWNYELALRSHWFDSQLLLNANVFYNIYEDQQITEESTNDPQYSRNHIGNSGKSHSYGSELELVYRPQQIKGLEIFANVGLLKTKFDDYETGDTNFTGNEFDRAPKVSGSLGVSYSHSSGIFAGIECLYRGDIYEASDNVDTNEAYVVVDAKIGYQYNDKYSIYDYGKNILDEEYYTSFDSEGGPGDQEIGLPQSFGVVLDYKF